MMLGLWSLLLLSYPCSKYVLPIPQVDFSYFENENHNHLMVPFFSKWPKVIHYIWRKELNFRHMLNQSNSTILITVVGVIIIFISISRMKITMNDGTCWTKSCFKFCSLCLQIPKSKSNSSLFNINWNFDDQCSASCHNLRFSPIKKANSDAFYLLTKRTKLQTHMLYQSNSTISILISVRLEYSSRTNDRTGQNFTS